MNAEMMTAVQGMAKEEAQQAYINLVKELFKKHGTKS